MGSKCWAYWRRMDSPTDGFEDEGAMPSGRTRSKLSTGVGGEKLLIPVDSEVVGEDRVEWLWTSRLLLAEEVVMLSSHGCRRRAQHEPAGGDLPSGDDPVVQYE